MVKIIRTVLRGPDDSNVVRLPDKACRGDQDARMTPWDGSPDPERSNYSDSKIGATSAVGCFPNGITPYGCEDMIGNTWEWTTTKWVDSYDNYAETEDNVIDASEDTRVLRGGSWILNPRNARCASRNYYYPSNVHPDFGVRCVLSPSSLDRTLPSG